eukprot:4076912-Alexandrium_andersonii.AAC.1
MPTPLSPSPSAKRIVCGLRDLNFLLGGYGVAGPGRLLLGLGAQLFRLRPLHGKAAVRAKPDSRCLQYPSTSPFCVPTLEASLCTELNLKVALR